jgi:hypothetical protein
MPSLDHKYHLASNRSINLNYLLLLLVVAQQVLQVGLRLGPLLLLQTQQTSKLAHLRPVAHPLTAHDPPDLLNQRHRLPSISLLCFGPLHGSRQGQVDWFAKGWFYFVFWGLGLPMRVRQHRFFFFLDLFVGKLFVEFANEGPVFGIGHFGNLKDLIREELHRWRWS